MAVAPIFEHGDGRGAVGCVVVSPPVFLSEQEALTVIREELARFGIELTATQTKLEGVEFSERKARYDKQPNGDLRPTMIDVPGTAKAVTLDGSAPTHHLSVEMVSRQDYFELGGIRSGSSVQSYDLKSAATELATRIRDRGRGGAYVGVFYDPVSLPSRRPRNQLDWKATRARLEAQSRDRLRQQVQDFVSWLRASSAAEST
jgi:hypothetical protein